MSTEDDLLSSLDKAAMHLLSKAGVSDIVGASGNTQAVTLAEQVKAFEAVVDWAKTRRDLAPKAPTESPFDAIRAKFNGAPPERGRNSRAAKKAKADGGSDEPAAAEPASELFA